MLFETTMKAQRYLMAAGYWWNKELGCYVCEKTGGACRVDLDAGSSVSLSFFTID